VNGQRGGGEQRDQQGRVGGRGDHNRRQQEENAGGGGHEGEIRLEIAPDGHSLVEGDSDPDQHRVDSEEGHRAEQDVGKLATGKRMRGTETGGVVEQLQHPVGGGQ
jgi:hypothetical protein